MLSNDFLSLCWGTAVFSAVWFCAALVKPGFINILYRKNCQLPVAVCSAVTAFLFFISLVAVLFLFEHYTFIIA